MNHLSRCPEQLFTDALALTPAERAAYLERACEGDAVLQARVLALLEAYAESESLLAPAVPTITALDLHDEKSGDWIGRYKLLRKIGEGGCGVVWMAEQEEPVRRHIALKVIKLGMDTKAVVARFEAERQALAMMDHPHIAKVLDAGATEAGRPFFVMDLVRGIPITKYCDENQATPAARLALFILVCHAIQHAHQKGIIHRDIKPSNILVTATDGAPTPKVIDFGIAKATEGRLTDSTEFTGFGQFMGTPAYMSPEQTDMSAIDIDTRTDIYSLGVLLYELLTGKPPFDPVALTKAGLEECRRQIRETEPQTLSRRVSVLGAEEGATIARLRGTTPAKLALALRGDIDHIVIKAMEKDRTRRYASAGSLASDLQRHLQHEPVVARPPSKIYRLQKAFRRNRLAFTTAAVFLVSLAIGAGVSTSLFFKQRSAARRSEYIANTLTDMLDGVGPSVALGRDVSMLRDILNKTAQRLDVGLANEPEIEAELRFTIGSAYLKLGEFGNAEKMLRRALQLRTSLFGKSDRRLADPLKYLARVLVNRGFDPKDLAEAEKLLRAALEIEGKSPEDARVALTLHILASAFQRQSRYSDAETVHRRALEIRRRVWGGEHPDVAASLDSLGLVLQRQTRFEEAEKMHREALGIRVRLFGSEHPDVAVSHNNLGRVLQRQKKLGEAEAEFRKALDLSRKFLPKDHPDLAGALSDLGVLLSRLNRVDEAQNLEREALAIRRKDFGTGVFVATSLYNLGKYARARGEIAEAEASFQEAWSIVKPPLTDRLELQADIAQQLAEIYAARAKLEESAAGPAAEWKQRHLELNAAAKRKAK